MTFFLIVLSEDQIHDIFLISHILAKERAGLTRDILAACTDLEGAIRMWR